MFTIQSLEYVGSVAGLVVLFLAVLGAAIKWLFPIILDTYNKNIERIHSRELTQLESRLQVHMDSIVKSLEIANQISDSYREKTIEAVTLLWEEILYIERTFASLSAVVSILTKEELLSAIRRLSSLDTPVGETSQIREALIEFAAEGKIEEILSGRGKSTYQASNILSVRLGIFPPSSDEVRPFVSESTYGLYRIFASVYGRLAHLVRIGIESGKPVYWMDDQLMSEIVLTVLPEDKWKEIRKLEFSRFSNLIKELESLFIKEAKKDIRGIEDLTESAAEVSQVYRFVESKSSDMRDLS